MNVLKCLLLTVFLFIIGMGAQAQDKIILKDSAKITAYVQAVDSAYIYFIPVDKETGKGTSDEPIKLILTDVDEVKYNYTQSLNAPNSNSRTRRPRDTTDFSQKADNIVFAGVFGTTGIAGFAYERVVFKKEKFFMGLSAGVGFSLNGVSVPHHISFNFGKTKHCLELGIGGSYMAGEVFSTNYNLYAIYPIVGYRMQPATGFSVRAHLSPMVFVVQPDVNANIIPVIPMLGASLGYAF